MHTNLFSRKRLAWGLGVALAASGLGVVYGCSSDEEPSITDETKDGGGGGRNDAANGTDTGGPVDSGGTTGTKARANIKPTSDGGTVNGTAQFEPAPGGGVKMTIAISGATPGLHGLHVHQVGDCGAAPDGGAPGTAAGGHWNVGDAGHGFPSADGGAHHTGDMGNITIGSNGTGSYTFTNTQWTIAPGTYSVVGHSVVFHAGSDDGISQPTGDAGARPGCGVIILE